MCVQGAQSCEAVCREGAVCISRLCVCALVHKVDSVRCCRLCVSVQGTMKSTGSVYRQCHQVCLREVTCSVCVCRAL